MADSAIQLVKHPVRHARPCEQVPRLADEIIKVEGAASAFLVLIRDQCIQPDFQQRGGTLHRFGQLQLYRQGLHPRHF